MFRRLIIISSAIMIGSATVGADTDVCPQLLSDSVAQAVAPGMTLFLYTDGLTEAENGNRELFGMQRIDEVIKALEKQI